jgi:Tfp pilus assembly protein PilW
MSAVPPRRGEAGYTVAELLVVTAVIGMVMAGLLGLLMSGQQSYVVGSNRAEAQQTARLVIARLVQDVRTAGYDPRSIGFTAVTALAPPNVGFVIANDWNGSGAIELNLAVAMNGIQRGEQVTYTVVGSALRRQESFLDGAPVEVTNAIDSLTLQYFDADDVLIASPHLAVNAALIRTIVITVVTRPDTQSSVSTGQVAISTTSRVRIRNRS